MGPQPTTAGGSTTAGADLATVLGQIRDGMATATRDVDAFVAGVDALLPALPAPVAAAASDQLGGITQPFRLTQDELDRLLALPGDPDALRTAASLWAGDVARLVSGVAATTNINVMAADDRWSGAAAEAYRAVIPLQAAALTALTTASTEINTALEDYAAGLVSFWIAIGAAVVALCFAVAALVAAAVTAVTVIGLIVALIAAGTAITAALATIVTGYGTFSQKQAADSATLTNRLDTNTAFPGGKWPVSTDDLSDASITDGDGTDWSLGS